MWMMGCSDMTDSFNGRKLRPLMPRPTSNGANTGHINGTDLFSLNTHLASVTEQSKKEFSAQPVVSSRWNPTPEQLRALEELYRRGTRTPTADQIQHITAQLRRFGKIEGKNVFYWFQNHKARERQKRRRRLESAADEQQRCDNESLGRKESGGSRTGFEVEQTRNWAPPTNCSKLAEESVSLHKAAVAESRGELQQRRSSIERHATWQMMRLSCSPPTHLINTIATATTDPKLVHNQNLNIFTTSNRVNLDNLPCMGAYQNREECGESQTLELFPLRSDNDNGADDAEKGTELPIPTMNSDFTPYQFFEFLPLKN